MDHLVHAIVKEVVDEYLGPDAYWNVDNDMLGIKAVGGNVYILSYNQYYEFIISGDGKFKRMANRYVRKTLKSQSATEFMKKKCYLIRKHISPHFHLYDIEIAVAKLKELIDNNRLAFELYNLQEKLYGDIGAL